MSEAHKQLTELSETPKSFGKNKYFVELFFTERLVVTVYADSPEEAASRAKAAPYRNDRGNMAIPHTRGIAHVHFDEDFDVQVNSGEVQQDDDAEEDG